MSSICGMGNKLALNHLDKVISQNILIKKILAQLIMGVYQCSKLLK